MFDLQDKVTEFWDECLGIGLCAVGFEGFYGLGQKLANGLSHFVEILFNISYSLRFKFLRITTL